MWNHFVITVVVASIAQQLLAVPVSENVSRPSPVNDMAITILGDNVLLTWSTVEGAEAYNLYRLDGAYGVTESLLGTSMVTSFSLVGELHLYESAFYAVRVVYDDPPQGMALIPAGTFTMGSTEGNSDEMPVHQVTLTQDFYLNTLEVTNAEYLNAVQWAYDQGLVTASSNTVQAHGVELIALDDENCEITFSSGVFGLRESPSSYAQNAYPAGYDPSDHPVKEVYWYGAACYCDWISMMAGAEAFYNGNWNQTAEHNPYSSPAYRLPTEAEWEYAISFNDERTHPWGDEEPDCNLANFHNNGYCTGWTAPVGSYPAGNSHLDLMDMGGNVYEWIGDWYDHDYYEVSPETDPLGPDGSSGHALRGGGWSNYARHLRCAKRYYYNTGFTNRHIGFRVARSANL